MFTESTRVRLGEQHQKKLAHLRQQTGLNTSQIMRILIDSAVLEVRAIFPEKKQTISVNGVEAVTEMDESNDENGKN